MAFDWRFNSTAIAAGGLLASSAPSGHVAAGSKQTITLRARPGIPERVQAEAFFEIAHFDPVRVSVTVEGVYASLATSLPRAPADEWPGTVARALGSIRDHGSRLLEAVLRKDRKAARELKSTMQSGALTALLPFSQSQREGAGGCAVRARKLQTMERHQRWAVMRDLACRRVVATGNSKQQQAEGPAARPGRHRGVRQGEALQRPGDGQGHSAGAARSGGRGRPPAPVRRSLHARARR